MNLSHWRVLIERDSLKNLTENMRLAHIKDWCRKFEKYCDLVCSDKNLDFGANDYVKHLLVHLKKVGFRFKRLNKLPDHFKTTDRNEFLSNMSHFDLVGLTNNGIPEFVGDSNESLNIEENPYQYNSPSTGSTLHMTLLENMFCSGTDLFDDLIMLHDCKWKKGEPIAKLFDTYFKHKISASKNLHIFSRYIHDKADNPGFRKFLEQVYECVNAGKSEGKLKVKIVVGVKQERDQRIKPEEVVGRIHDNFDAFQWKIPVEVFVGVIDDRTNPELWEESHEDAHVYIRGYGTVCIGNRFQTFSQGQANKITTTKVRVICHKEGGPEDEFRKRLVEEVEFERLSFSPGF